MALKLSSTTNLADMAASFLGNIDLKAYKTALIESATSFKVNADIIKKNISAFDKKSSQMLAIIEKGVAATTAQRIINNEPVNSNDLTVMLTDINTVNNTLTKQTATLDLTLSALSEIVKNTTETSQNTNATALLLNTLSQAAKHTDKALSGVLQAEAQTTTSTPSKTAINAIDKLTESDTNLSGTVAELGSTINTLSAAQHTAERITPTIIAKMGEMATAITSTAATATKSITQQAESTIRSVGTGLAGNATETAYKALGIDPVLGDKLLAGITGAGLSLFTLVKSSITDRKERKKQEVKTSKQVAETRNSSIKKKSETTTTRRIDARKEANTIKRDKTRSKELKQIIMMMKLSSIMNMLNFAKMALPLAALGTGLASLASKFKRKSRVKTTPTKTPPNKKTPTKTTPTKTTPTKTTPTKTTPTKKTPKVFTKSYKTQKNRPKKVTTKATNKLATTGMKLAGKIGARHLAATALTSVFPPAAILLNALLLGLDAYDGYKALTSSKQAKQLKTTTRGQRKQARIITKQPPKIKTAVQNNTNDVLNKQQQPIIVKSPPVTVNVPPQQAPQAPQATQKRRTSFDDPAMALLSKNTLG